MPHLFELQRRVRDAVVLGDDAALATLLVGGRNPGERLVIHRRQYHTSLVTALLGRFPATAWLVGSRAVYDAAVDFVPAHPPMAPCIAEFGVEFPAFLAETPVAQRAPYVVSFAEFEWHVGRVSVAVDSAPLQLAALTSVPVDAVPSIALTLQSGVHYAQAAWPIDELMTLFVTSGAPGSYALAPEYVRLELRGERGDFRITRLDAGTFAFRAAVARGAPIGHAADAALDADAAFEPDHALVSLFEDNLVTGFSEPSAPDHSTLPSTALQ